MIRVDSLTKNYAGFPALRGVSFEVQPGEVVGFLGPNGAGKTTTLRILSGFMPASAGRAEVGGFDIATHSREARSRIGYLPEDVPLYRDLTVTAFLRYIGGLKEIPNRSLGGEIDRVVAITDLEPVAKRQIGKCSKGYRQRTGLAQALLGDPPVLLLDEATSGLDPNQVVEVRELIRELSGEKTVLLSSHVLSEISQICGRVLIINQGELVGSGSPESLARALNQNQILVVRTHGESLERSSLERIDGVLRVDSEGEGTWRLQVDGADTVAPHVAKAVVASGTALIELRPEIADLETVFRALTAETADA